MTKRRTNKVFSPYKVNIITREKIVLDGVLLVRGQDYIIEETTGALFFSERITNFTRGNNKFVLHSTIDRKLAKYVKEK